MPLLSSVEAMTVSSPVAGSAQRRSAAITVILTSWARHNSVGGMVQKCLAIGINWQPGRVRPTLPSPSHSSQEGRSGT